MKESRFFNPKDTLLNEIDKLYKTQSLEWELFRENLKPISNPIYKEIEIENFKFKVLLNQKRKKSITEDVSKKAIEKRKCFLCIKNLPEKEKGIIFKDSYLILVNPYPILKNHFVLPSLKHIPQQISPHTEVLFSLFERIKEKFFILYNGPKCGASAPDHFHLQFCDLKELIILKIYEKNSPKEKIFINSNYPIHHILISSNSTKEVKNLFLETLKRFENYFKEEPPINLILFSAKDKNYLLIFLRKRHRPTCFYEKGENKILISPGAIDLSGTFITPEKKHFEKINREILLKIIDEVIYKKDFLEKIL